MITVLIHLATNLWQAHLGFGFHRDELYHLVCAQHLAWGYVDQAPLVALQGWLAFHLFGDSLAGIRMLTAYRLHLHPRCINTTAPNTTSAPKTATTMSGILDIMPQTHSFGALAFAMRHPR